MDEKFKRLFDSLPESIKQGHQEAIKELMELAPKNRFSVGDQVVLYKSGGTVTSVDKGEYGISVEFREDGSPSCLSFTPDGKILDTDEKPSLFLTEEFFRMMESGL
jgi:hypothetical protein